MNFIVNPLSATEPVCSNTHYSVQIGRYLVLIVRTPDTKEKLRYSDWPNPLIFDIQKTVWYLSYLGPVRTIILTHLLRTYVYNMTKRRGETRSAAGLQKARQRISQGSSNRSSADAKERRDAAS